MMKKQKKIDDVQVSIIMKALEQGIEIQSNDVYNQMMKEYPHY